MSENYDMFEQLAMLEEINKAMEEELAELEEEAKETKKKKGVNSANTADSTNNVNSASVVQDSIKADINGRVAAGLKSKTDSKVKGSVTMSDSVREMLDNDCFYSDKSIVDIEKNAIAELVEKAGGRKPFRIPDFDTPRDREMAVFTHAKKLSEYIFVITEKSPVKFRWNILSRLLNTSTDIIEYLYHANYNRGSERIMWQKKAMVAMCLLDFYAETAKTKQAITFRQMEIIGRQISDVKKLLSGWVRATKKRDKQDGFN